MSEEVKTILAIDDNLTTLTQIRTILEGFYEVSLAKNTEIAKKILKSTNVSLILLDVNMPGESGIDFMEELQKDPTLYHIPVIIVSSEGTPDIIINSKKRGAADFVVKPIASQILKDKIKTILKTARTRNILRTSRARINRDSLIRKLKNWGKACAAGKSTLVEEILEDLESVYYNVDTDIAIGEVGKLIKEMEYDLADKKIKELLAYLAE